MITTQQAGKVAIRCFILVVLGLLAVWAFSGCGAAKVNIDAQETVFGKDGKVIYGKLYADGARGYMQPERYQWFLEEQERSTTRILLQQELQEAIKNGTPEQVKIVMKKIEAVYGAVAEYRILAIVNDDPKFVVTPLNGPFTDVSIGPKTTTSDQRPFPVGLFPLKYRWEEIGTDQTGVKTINVYIGKGRTDPIRFKVK